MATHPDIQEKLWLEVSEVIGSERPPNQLDRLKMPYTMAVFWEILRFACLLPINLPHMWVLILYGHFFILRLLFPGRTRTVKLVASLYQKGPIFCLISMPFIMIQRLGVMITKNLNQPGSCHRAGRNWSILIVSLLSDSVIIDLNCCGMLYWHCHDIITREAIMSSGTYGNGRGLHLHVNDDSKVSNKTSHWRPNSLGWPHEWSITYSSRWSLCQIHPEE